MRAFEHRHAGLRFTATESGEGQPMVFQHGLCGDASQPADVFPLGEGWRSITLDCRGHGGSEPGPPDRFSISTFADDVASLIEAEKLAPVVLGGISMGAAIAMSLAVRNPQLVRALVLARPAWLSDRAPANMQPNEVVGNLLRRYPPSEARALFENSEIARRLQAEAPDNLASLRGFFSRQPIAVTRELLCRISTDGPGVDATSIAKISVPTLVVGNAFDLVHPLEHAKSLAAMVPKAHFIEITSKAISRERYRSDFQTALAAFLKES